MTTRVPQSLTNTGTVCVTDPPYNADPTGLTNSSSAFSSAAAASFYPFIPPGTYLLNSNTTGSAIWNVPPGVVLTGSGILSGTVTRIPIGQQSITIYVDSVNGVDGPLRGRGAGASACQTIQGAFNNLVQEYDFLGNNTPPTIQLAAGQTFTGGLVIQQGQTVTAFSSGINQVIIDGANSTIDSTTGTTIFIRGYPIWLVLQNMVITCSGTKGNLIETYGGGTHVELNGGVTFGACPAPYAQLSATRYGRISSRPGIANYTIAGGVASGMFSQAIIGGRIEWEGTVINIGLGVSYSVAFAQADGAGSSCEFSKVAFTGAAPTGPAYNVSKLAEINTNALIGGQVIPVPIIGNVTTNNFTGAQGHGYLPGSTPGAMGFLGGMMDNPGQPTITGGGTGVIIQGAEPSFNIVMGTGNGFVAGTTYTMTVTMTTVSNYRNFICTTNDPGSLGALRVQWTGPISSVTPGNAVISYTGTGYSPDLKVIWCELGNVDPAN